MNRRRFHRRVYLGILKRQRNICACGCGVKMTRAEGYEADHILALWNGGADDADNLQFLRAPCHKAKTIDEAPKRAKANRIVKQDGLRKPKLSKRDKALARWRAKNATGIVRQT